jgi:L-amino acid N-acyltransferase YncA
MIAIRDATAGDLDAIADMLEDFVANHPAKSPPRSRDKLREALFGEAPVAHVLVAVDGGRVIGMVQVAHLRDRAQLAIAGAEQGAGNPAVTAGAPVGRARRQLR